MVERAEIQDLLVDQEDVLFVQGALDFYDNTFVYFTSFAIQLL